MSRTDSRRHGLAAAALGTAVAAGLAATPAAATIVSGDGERILGTPAPPGGPIVGKIVGGADGLRARVDWFNTGETHARIYRASQISPGFTITNRTDARNLVTIFESDLADDPAYNSVSTSVPAVHGERYVATFKGTYSQWTHRAFYQCEYDGFFGSCK